MKHRLFHISFAYPVSVDLGINPLCELFTSSGGLHSFVMTQLSGFIAQMKIVSDWDHGSSMTLTCVASLLPSNHKSHVLTVLSGGQKREGTEAVILSSVACMSSCVCTLASKLSARALQSVMSCSSFDADCSFDADDSGISDVHSSESSSDSALLYARQHDLLPDPAELYPDLDDLLRDSASFEVLPVSHVSEDAKQKVAAPEPKLCSKPKRKLRMIDEDKDGVRIKILPSPRAQFRRRMQQSSIITRFVEEAW